MATIASMHSTEMDFKHPILIQQIYKNDTENSNFKDSERHVQDQGLSTLHTDRKRHSISKVNNARSEMNATRITLTQINQK